ncbi:Endo-1,4-beta-xylanase A precursor [compost metagenome]
MNGIAHVIDSFNQTYVKRTIQINGTLDSRYATAVRYDPVTDNFSFVPSVFTTQGGLTEASIQRNGNSIYAVVEAQKSFEDTVGHWAQAHIERMASKQIIQGQTDRLFAPDHLITRAEFTALLVRSLGVTPRIDHGSFTDVPASSWYAEPVSTAVGLGLIEGFDKGLFQPESLLNREQMALIISRAIQFTGKSKPIVWQTETTLSSVVDEKEISNWARSEVAYLIHEQILQGFPDGTFRPDEAVSRSQAAVTLQRMLEYAGFMN